MVDDLRGSGAEEALDDFFGIHTAEPASAAPGDVGAADPDDCPVKALGHHDGVYYFLSSSGELRTMKVREFSANGMLSLFAGDAAWMIRRFPRLDDEGKPINDFVLRGVVGYLIRQSEKAGIYDPSIKLRRRGVWRGRPGADGRPAAVLHAGNRIARVDGGAVEWHPAGWRDGRVVYPAAPRMDLPNFAAPATAADGARLLDCIKLWRFRGGDADARLYLGLFGQALLAGYPSWRAHGQIAAEFGAGKTWLCGLFAAGLGPLAEEMNGYSEPSLRQILTDEARIAVLDEAENSADGAMQKVIGLLRLMSARDGANVGRGTPGGQALRYSVTGAVMMAGINPPPLAPQDRSRIIRLDLLKATSDPAAAGRVEEAVAWVRSMEAAFRARALLGAQRFEATFARYRGALMAAGCDGRQADLLSVALAGADLLLFDRLPEDGDSIEEVIAPLLPRVAAMRADDEEDNNSRQCLHHLLGYIPDYWRAGTKVTVGELIAAARHEPGGAGENGKALRTYGIRVEVPADGSEPFALVANKHPSLLRVFHGTAWQGGGWAGALGNLGEDVTSHKTERFAGVPSRSMRLPAAYLPDVEGAAA